MTNMARECFIMSDGNLLLFGLCMYRIGCVSITCFRRFLEVHFMFLKACVTEEKNVPNLDVDNFQNGYYTYDVTSHVFPSPICI